MGTGARSAHRRLTAAARRLTQVKARIRFPGRSPRLVRTGWSDEELVARSISGDQDSFNQLILRWERPIYALAYRTIGREEDARDIVQETFLRAFRALPGFKGQAKFSSWLYRIALNLCRDWIRRKKRTRYSRYSRSRNFSRIPKSQLLRPFQHFPWVRQSVRKSDIEFLPL